ncbi:MAG: glycosyltransferase family 4 protein [Chloroflexi bacterium]|nr:glycosyltransferase family 4 protein [Chloroflexota bacterium]
MQRIFPDRPDARLLILTRALPEQQGLTDDTFRDVLPQIVMGGWLEGETLAAAYHLADAVAAPSICLDVFPTVNLEAMAAGKPVVATCFGGSPEAVADSATGHIVQPFDIAALSGSLAALLDDPERAAAMGAAGRGRFTEGFTAQHAAARMDAVCRSTVSGELIAYSDAVSGPGCHHANARSRSSSSVRLGAAIMPDGSDVISCAPTSAPARKYSTYRCVSIIAAAAMMSYWPRAGAIHPASGALADTAVVNAMP